MRVWIAQCCAVLAVSCAVVSGMAMADEQKPAADTAAAAAEQAPVAAATVPAASKHVHRVAARPAKQTFFQKVMELERRKNAWIMRNVFGR